MKLDEPVHTRSYELLVSNDPVALVWLTLSRCTLAQTGGSGWRIDTFGESPNHMNREDGSAYFRTTQCISDQLEFVAYESEDANRTYSVRKEDEWYVFRDDQHIITRAQFEPFSFIMENNNFAAISALCHLFKSVNLSPESDVRYLPLGFGETLALDLEWCDGNVVRFAGIDVVCDSTGFIETACSTPASLYVRCNSDALPECHDKALLNTSLSQAVNYAVHHEEGDVQTCIGIVQCSLSTNQALKRSGEAPVALFIGGTGRYTSSGYLLSGLNVGYGRFLDGLAHHGIDNCRYNRFTHFFSQTMPTHQQVVQQTHDMINHLIDTLARPVVLVGHSYGGVVAAQVAAARHDIPALVMISTPAGTMKQSIQWQRNNAIDKIEDTAIQEAYLDRARKFDDVVAGRSTFDANSMAQQAAEFIRSVGEVDVRQFASDVDCPMLLIHGAMDEQVPVSDLQKLEHAFNAHDNRVRSVVFEELGHFLKYRDSDPAQVKKVMEFDRDVADLMHSMFKRNNGVATNQQTNQHHEHS